MENRCSTTRFTAKSLPSGIMIRVPDNPILNILLSDTNVNEYLSECQERSRNWSRIYRKRLHFTLLRPNSALLAARDSRITINLFSGRRNLLAILPAIEIYVYEIFTFALKGTSRCRQQQFVSHRRGLHAPGYARFHIIFLHPLSQPAHAAIAVKRVGPQGAVNIVIDKWPVSKIECVWFYEQGDILTGVL